MNSKKKVNKLLDKYTNSIMSDDETQRIMDTKENQEKLFLEYVNKDTDYKEYRRELLEKFNQGVSIEGENGLRKKLAAIDLAYFGRAYLPHYFTRESPKFHDELNDIWKNGVMKKLNPIDKADVISRLDGCRRAIAAPRNHAKSTNFTFKDSLHAIIYKYKHYILIISDSSEQAEGFLSDIRLELEDNPIIKEDFGELKGDKAWKSSVLLTSTNIKIEAIGSGKKVRGRRHRNWRPDLIVMDDIENDENVYTKEQRMKLSNWFFKAVSKAGDTYTDIVYIGTILHYDSLLSNVMVNPKYISVRYCGVIRFAKNQKLWDAWEAIYCDLENPNRQEDAEVFYEANKEEMLEGTKVLWEENWSYYKLMENKIEIGEASFNSEIQNEPIDPNSATFNEEWFDYYEESLIDFKNPRFIFVGSNDPSLGKNKKSDTSSLFALAKDTVTGYMYVVEASVEIRKPDVIIQDAIEMSKRLRRDYNKGFFKFGVETVQFQYFFKDVMVQKSAEANEYLPIEEIQSTINKNLRIESLQPLIKNKFIKFNRKHKTLIKQLTEYPMGKNDDAPDGLEMVVRLAQKINGSTKTDYKSVISRALNFRKGAY